MKASRRRAERNKERIVEAALELFQAQGIKKVAIHDVARKAGVSPATVYNQFTDKETLVRESVIRWYIHIMEDYQNVFQAGQSFEEKLLNILSFKSDLAGRTHGEFLLATTSDDPEVRRFLESEYIAETRRFVSDFLEEGKIQGYINPEITLETYIRFTEIIRKGINAESDLSADPDYGTKLLHELTPFILYGMLGKPRK